MTNEYVRRLGFINLNEAKLLEWGKIPKLIGILLPSKKKREHRCV